MTSAKIHVPLVALFGCFSWQLLAMDPPEITETNDLDSLRFLLSKSIPPSPKAATKIGEGNFGVVYGASPFAVNSSNSDSASYNSSQVSSVSSRPGSQLTTPSKRKIFYKNLSPERASPPSPLSPRALGGPSPYFDKMPEFSQRNHQKVKLPLKKAVVKSRKCDQNSDDFVHEASVQREIRKALKKVGQRHLARHIPRIDKNSVTPNSFKMEKMDGEELWKIKDKDILNCSFFGFVSRLFEVVDAIHNYGYAHEDLSTKNILINISKLDKDNIPDFRLIDFGLSGKFGEKRTEADFAHYQCAPELIHSTTIDTKADIYALGQIVSELLNCNWNPSLGAQRIFQLRMLVSEMHHNDPEKRIDLKEALKRLNAINAER